MAATDLSREEIDLFFLAALVTVGPVYQASSGNGWDHPARQEKYVAFRRDWWKDDPRVEWHESQIIGADDKIKSYGLQTWHPLSIPEYEKWIDQREGIDRE